MNVGNVNPAIQNSHIRIIMQLSRSLVRITWSCADEINHLPYPLHSKCSFVLGYGWSLHGDEASLVLDL